MKRTSKFIKLLSVTLALMTLFSFSSLVVDNNALNVSAATTSVLGTYTRYTTEKVTCYNMNKKATSLTLEKGTVVTCIAVSGSYTQIKYRGTYVYVLTNKLSKTKPSTTVSSTKTTKVTMYTTERTQRYSYNSKTKKVSKVSGKYFPAKATVTFTGTTVKYKGVTYGKVKYNGATHYILYSKLSIYKPASYVRYAKSKTKVYTDDTTSAQVVKELGAGALVRVTGKHGSWLRIVYDGKTRYILSTSVSETPAKVNGYTYLSYDAYGKNTTAGLSTYLATAKAVNPSNALSSFKSSGWTICVTTQSIESFMKCYGITGSTNSNGGTTVGLCIPDLKMLVVKSSNFDVAAWHELGHFVYYKKVVANSERSKKWNNIYKAYKNAGNPCNYYNPKHTLDCANEFFAETFRRYILGYNIPEDAYTFIKTYGLV